MLVLGWFRSLLLFFVVEANGAVELANSGVHNLILTVVLLAWSRDNGDKLAVVDFPRASDKEVELHNALHGSICFNIAKLYACDVACRDACYAIAHNVVVGVHPA